MFSSLCNQIAVASAPFSPYDAPKKPLSILLNEMTRYVATSSKSDNDDETIIYGSVQDNNIHHVELFDFFSLISLQILLLSDVERVRAASIRALRYSIHRATIFDKFLEYRLDYLVCR
jgi:hypothetical protein